MDKHNLFRELMELIARYDWATEDAQSPRDNQLTQAQAKLLRNELVSLARKVG